MSQMKKMREINKDFFMEFHLLFEGCFIEELSVKGEF